MTSLLNPSFESGHTVNWGASATAWSYSYGQSTTTGVTDGTLSATVQINPDSRNTSGMYIYKTQTITIDSNFTVEFDWYNTSESAYEIVVLIDGTEYYSSSMITSSQKTDSRFDVVGLSGSKTFKIGIKSIATDTTSTAILYIDNIRFTDAETTPSETCQSTGLIYAGSIYYSDYGIASIHIVEISEAGAHNQLCNIVTPWGTEYDSEILEYEVLETYSRSITGGTEYYTLYCTFVVSGESAGAIYTECWYTDLGKRYVKTTGSDSALGNNWANAWLTMGYGFQNIPSGKDLYVEEGLYGGETLSNLDPPQTMSMYIQPSEHIEASCKVAVSDTDVFTDGTINATESGLNNIYTWIFPSTSISFDGTLEFFDFLVADPGTYKLKIFRDDGTNFIFIGESPYYTVSGTGTYTNAPCSITVEAGDIIGIKTVGCYIDAITSVSTSYFKNGDITSDSLKSSWQSTSTYDASIEVSGFKSV